MKTSQLLLMLLCFSLISSCNSQNEVQNTETIQETKKIVPKSTSFSIEGKEACDFLSVDDVAEVLKFDKNGIQVKSERNKDDHKICRFEIKSENKFRVLIVNINYNDRQELRPNQYSKRMTEAITNGLPVAGNQDQKQIFSEVGELATQAAYSDNMSDDKNLLFRIGEDYLINLEYNEFGGNLGNMEKELVELAQRLLK